MSQQAWDRIKNDKNFYIITFRRLVNMAMVSVLLNVLFCVAIGYFYFNHPPRDYYSTDGITAPTQLAPMDMPNNTAYPLLPDDPDDTLLSENLPIPK